jgi:cobalt-zinc-cadmium efflux system protein
MMSPTSEDPHHGHHHVDLGTQSYSRAFAVGIALNLGYVVVEIGYGLAAHSTALVADAVHNLSDVAGIAMAWAAFRLARRARNPRFTYGLRSATILAALANAMFLLVACGGIAWEAFQRFSTPPVVEGKLVIIVALIGVAVNAITALFFFRGRGHDLNIRGAFLHMAADAAVSFAVVISGVIMLKTNLFWIDPAISLGILLVIFWSTWDLLRESALLSLHAVPNNIDSDDVSDYLRQLSPVTGVHDLHIWALSTTDVALTAHLVVGAGHPGDDWLETLSKNLAHRFGIGHTTLQVETLDKDHACALEAE